MSDPTTLYAIVINGGALAAVPAADLPQFSMRLTGALFRNLVDPSKTAGATFFADKRVQAIAGIGNPARFFDSLRALGLTPECVAFADHHRYSAADLAFPGADCILMTDKDAIKCVALADERMWTLPVTAEVDPSLVQRLLEKLNGRQTA